MTVRYTTPCVWCREQEHKPGSSWRTTDDGHLACSQACEDAWCAATSPDAIHAHRAQVATARREGYVEGVEAAAKLAMAEADRSAEAAGRMAREGHDATAEELLVEQNNFIEIHDRIRALTDAGEGAP